MLVVDGQKNHEINVDFTNFYTISFIMIEGDKSGTASVKYASRGWKVGVYEYDADSDWENLVDWCENEAILDDGLYWSTFSANCSDIVGNRVKLKKQCDVIDCGGQGSRSAIASIAVFSNYTDLE